MHKTLTLMALAAVAAVLLAACGSSGASELTGKNWQLTAITEKVPAFQGVIPPADQERYVITFNTDGTFNGTADCNQIAGTWAAKGASGLTITTGPSTLALCPDGSFDTLFVHGLGRVTSYAIANDTLTLTTEDEGTMVFVVGVAAGSTPGATTAAQATAKPTATPTAKPTPKPTAKPTAAPTARPTAAPTAGATAAPTPKPTPKPTATPAPSPATGLVGGTWQLTAITQKNPAFQGVVPAEQQANYTVTFAADGTFSSKADCNNLSGVYNTVDATAATGDLMLDVQTATTAACADGSYSDLYMLALTSAASYAIADSELTITLHDGGTLVYSQAAS